MLGRVYTQYHQYFAILQHNLGQFDVINAFDVNNDGAVCTRHYALYLSIMLGQLDYECGSLRTSVLQC